MIRGVLWLSLATLTVSFCTDASANSRWRYRLASDFISLASTDVISEHHDESVLKNAQTDIRFMYVRTKSHWSFEFHGVGLGMIRNVDVVDGPSSGLDHREPLSSSFLNLSRNVAAGRQHKISVNIDRLRLSYRSQDWRFTIGRVPLSWGRGIVYQPLDVFNAYPPTTIDREFKSGNDTLILERLFNNGSEFQFLNTFRERRSEVSESTSTHALKGYFSSGENEFDLILGQHWNETIAGVSIAFPLGSFLMRTDLVVTCEEFDSCTTSAVTNADYSLGIKGGLLYTFFEYFYNGFGVTSKHKKATSLPSRLLIGVQRGEIFAFGRHQVATGASVTWHPLWSQSLSLLLNANDRSFMIQSNVSYIPTDNVNLTFGVRLPVGDTNEEFGAIELVETATTGGNPGLFLEFSYYQ